MRLTGLRPFLHLTPDSMGPLNPDSNPKGIFSGLTLGLLSLDVMSLKVLMEGGHPQERENAKKILPLVENHHQLLVTLLVGSWGHFAMRTGVRVMCDQSGRMWELL